jgi:hypothetical protein
LNRPGGSGASLSIYRYSKIFFKKQMNDNALFSFSQNKSSLKTSKT